MFLSFPFFDVHFHEKTKEKTNEPGQKKKLSLLCLILFLGIEASRITPGSILVIQLTMWASFLPTFLKWKTFKSSLDEEEVKLIRLDQGPKTKKQTEKKEKMKEKKRTSKERREE